MYTNANCCFTSPSRSAVCTVLPKQIIISKKELWRKTKQTFVCVWRQTKQLSVKDLHTFIQTRRSRLLNENTAEMKTSSFLALMLCFAWPDYSEIQCFCFRMMCRNSKNLHEYALKLDKAQSGWQKWVKIKCQSAKLAWEWRWMTATVKWGEF